MHLIGADLYLKRLPIASNQGGVQGLVHILFWHGYIVFKTARNGLIHLMDDTQGSIAVLHGLNHDTHCEQIIYLVQSLVLVHHLFIDTEEMLHTSAHRGLNARILHVALDLVHDFLDKGLSCILAEGHLLHQVVIYIRLKELKGQIVQFNLNLGNTQSVSDGSIDLHGFPGFFLLLLRLPVLTGPHVVETVRQLDDNDADVLCHGQKHLAQVVRLDFHLVLIPV